VKKPSDLGWFIYLHDSHVTVTTFDRASYVPYNFVERPTISAFTNTYLEVTPKQLNFLSRPEEPCTDLENYVYELV
jgi:hypothetical protein